MLSKWMALAERAVLALERIAAALDRAERAAAGTEIIHPVQEVTNGRTRVG